MRTTGLLVLVVGGWLMAADGPKEEAARKDLDRMQGTWMVTVHELNGQKTTAEQNQEAKSKLVVKGDKYTVYFGDQRITEGVLKLDPTRKPRTIDALAADGPAKGQAMPGIYELEGDDMRVCFGQPGKERPTAFATQAGTNQILLGYKRVKP